MNSPETHVPIDWLFPALFAVLMVSVLAWFILMSRLFRILRTRHPQIYDRLGRPTLFLNNSIQNSFAVTRFLLGGHFRQLDDPALLRLGGFMQIFFYGYSVLFLCFAGLIIFGAAIFPR